MRRLFGIGTARSLEAFQVGLDGLLGLYQLTWITIFAIIDLTGANSRATKPGSLTSSDEYKVTLKAPVRIVGSVVDAETGKPLERFTLIPGTDYGDGSNPFWNRWDAKLIANQGRFETTVEQEKLNYLIRIQADGYMPSYVGIGLRTTPDLHGSQASVQLPSTNVGATDNLGRGEIKFEFKLRKAAPLTGTVLGLDGKPLAGADVYLSTERVNIDKRVVNFSEAPPIKTDASGRFQCPPEVEPFCLVVVHEQGIAMITEAECKTPPHITIEPWTAKSEQLQIIRKPAHGQHSDFPRRQELP